MKHKRMCTQSCLIPSIFYRTFHNQNSGQQMPTGQDKTDFQAFLLSAARGIPPPKLLHFHRHLIEYGDKDALPLLEKDLIFYLEAQRFKVCGTYYSHAWRISGILRGNLLFRWIFWSFSSKNV